MFAHGPCLRSASTAHGIVPGVQLARVTEKLNGVTDGDRRKVNRVIDGATGKRSAGPHFTHTERASVATITLATICAEYAMHTLSTYMHSMRILR